MFSLRGLFKAEDREEPAPVIRGSMHRAIVLKAPDDTFSEAVFILKDSFLQGEGVSRKELLRQAAEAATGYCGRRRQRPLYLTPTVIFLLGAASAVLMIWGLGLLGILV